MGLSEKCRTLGSLLVLLLSALGPSAQNCVQILWDKAKEPPSTGTFWSCAPGILCDLHATSMALWSQVSFLPADASDKDQFKYLWKTRNRMEWGLRNMTHVNQTSKFWSEPLPFPCLSHFPEDLNGTLLCALYNMEKGLNVRCRLGIIIHFPWILEKKFSQPSNSTEHQVIHIFQYHHKPMRWVVCT